MTRNGIHHVTAIAGAAQSNLDFYTRVLGLRLVKKTVNFDDPGTYHFYYGDETGAPGSILTFFAWDGVPRGRIGIGTTEETAFRVPEGAIGFWTHRLLAAGIAFEPLHRRFGAPVLAFKDPDGLPLALVGTPGLVGTPAWTAPGIAADHAVRGFAGVTLMLADAAPTAAILEDVFGFVPVGRAGARLRLAATTDPSGLQGGIVDLHAVGSFLPVQAGGGTVHHIAFRAADDAAQAAMVRRLAETHKIRTTEQKDRNYFRSVYFKEPGGVLFEIATDVPGFAVDEAATALGAALKLPAFLEPHRQRIEAVLPQVA